jgi:BirA family biotin operon repressor/biotin-[acetyl-CoA-carboxylase] ligase
MPVEWQTSETGVGPDGAAGALAMLAARRPDVWLSVAWMSVTGSTMDELATRAEQGAPAGTVVGADRQTAGRGRRGHLWASPPQAGLYLSYLLRPRGDVSLVTLAAGVGLMRALSAVGVTTAELKWPNDVMVGRRKLAGVLTEGAHLGTPQATVVVGVGLNVQRAAYPPDVAARAVSLDELGVPSVGRDGGRLLAVLLESLHDVWHDLDRGRHEAVRDEWIRSAPSAVGARVSWDDPSGPMAGVTSGIDASGALRVQTRQRGEVVVRGAVQWECFAEATEAARGRDV